MERDGSIFPSPVRPRPLAGVRLAAARLAAGSLAAGGLAAALFGGAAAAQDPFASLVGKRSFAPVADRTGAAQAFRTAVDDRAFLLQSGRDEARIRFLCAEGETRFECLFETAPRPEEVLTLKPARVSRGDVVFLDETGAPVLRIAAHGGAAVSWPGESHSRAASPAPGMTAEIAPPVEAAGLAEARAAEAGALAARLTGAPLALELDAFPGEEATAAGTGVLADAVVLAAKGVVAARLATGRLGEPPTLIFERSTSPGLAWREDAVVVRYAPDKGFYGRPSSAAVAKFLQAAERLTASAD